MNFYDDIVLPIRLIDIQMGDKCFILEFKDFVRNTNDNSICRSKLLGIFEITYKCNGMSCCFECDMSIGNLYYFYLELDTAYDIEFSTNAKAILSDYNSDKTNIIVQFDDKCRCELSGHIKNKIDNYRSGIEFTINIEQSDVCDILVKLDKFLREMKQIQGNYNFI